MLRILVWLTCALLAGCTPADEDPTVDAAIVGDGTIGGDDEGVDSAVVDARADAASDSGPTAPDAGSDSGDAMAPDAGLAPEPELADDVFVIPSPLDEAVEVEAARLVFPDRADSAWLADVPVGAILVGGSAAPLLRSVRSIERAEGEFRIETGSAVLTDVFRTARLRATLDTPVDAPKGLDAAIAVDFGGTVLVEDGDFRLELSRGRVEFDPDITLEVDIQDGALVRGLFTVGGELTVEMAIAAVAETGAGWSDTVELWTSPPRVFVQFIGLVPVVEVVTFSLEAGYEAEVHAGISAEVGGEATLTVAAGVETEFGEWSPVAETMLDAMPIGPSWEAEAGLSARVFLRPRLDVKFYGLAGPWLSLEPDVRFNGRLLPSPPACSVALGAIGRAGFEVGALDVEAVNYDAELFDVSTIIYQCPRCGDGDCNGFEDCASCPVDCGVCADNAIALGGNRVDRIGFDGAAVSRFEMDNQPSGGIEIGDRARGLATNIWFSDRAVATNGRDGTVSFLSMRRGTEAEIRRLDLETFAGEVSLSPSGDNAFVSLPEEEAVAIIDMLTMTESDRIPLESGAQAPAGLPAHSVITRVAVPRPGQPYPDLEVRLFVAMPGTPNDPSGRIAMHRYWPVPSCSSGTEYLDLPRRSRPAGMSLRPEGCTAGGVDHEHCLAVALQGTDRVALIDPVAFEVIDVKPDSAAERFFDAASRPLAVAWDTDGAHVLIGHAGGVPGTRLGGLGTVRRGRADSGHDEFDVGVAGAVNSLLHREGWTYAGDSLGNITALADDRWAGENASIDRDHTGGCLNERGRAEACPEALTLAGRVRHLATTERPDWTPEVRGVVLGSFATQCRIDCLNQVGAPHGAAPITDTAPDGVDLDAFVLGLIDTSSVIVFNTAWLDPCRFTTEIELPYVRRDPALMAKTIWVDDDCGCE